jgi:hypothetical protein
VDCEIGHRVGIRRELAPFQPMGQNEAGLLKEAHVTKHQAKRIALTRVKHGTIKCVELEKDDGVLIWSVDITQPGKKDLTDVWVDATTGKITVVNLETPTFEKEEVAEAKVKKLLSHRGTGPCQLR